MLNFFSERSGSIFYIKGFFIVGVLSVYIPNIITFKKLAKSLLLTYILFLFGFHYIYLGKYKLQILYLLTFGGFGIWFLYDCFTLLNRYFTINLNEQTLVNESKAGFYLIETGIIKPLDSLPKNCSINYIAQYLGYKENDIYMCLSPADKFVFFYVKRFTKEIIFIQSSSNFTIYDYNKALNLIN